MAEYFFNMHTENKESEILPLLKSEWVQYWGQGRAKPGEANPLRQY
jgi:hypothetical protein